MCSGALRPILKRVLPRVLALSLAVLIAGASEAIACAFACAAPTSNAPAAQTHHEHSGHHGDHAEPLLPEAALQAGPHDCGRAQQLLWLAEPSLQAKILLATLASGIAFLPPRQVESTALQVFAERPPGSRFLSTQLRI